MRSTIRFTSATTTSFQSHTSRDLVRSQRIKLLLCPKTLSIYKKKQAGFMSYHAPGKEKVSREILLEVGRSRSYLVGKTGKKHKIGEGERKAKKLEKKR